MEADKSPQDVCRLGLCDIETVQRSAHLLTVSGGTDNKRVLADYRLLLRQDPGSPFNWSSFAFSLYDAGDRAGADQCIAQAVRMAPGSAPLLMQVLNYYMTVGDYSEVLPVGRRLLSLVKDYDPFVFRYYEQAASSPSTVLSSGMPPDLGRGADYLGYLIGRSDQPDAEAAWKWLRDRGYTGRPALNAYTTFLIGQKAYGKAWAAWRNVLGNGSGGNFLFNGGFDQPIADGPFDWQLSKDSDAAITVDPAARTGGKASLRIDFSGQSNIAFQHVSHLIFARGGTLQLTGSVKCSGLTTNEGVFLRVSDRDDPRRFTFETEPIRERSDWKPFEYSLQVPGKDRLLRLEIVRRPSEKFDNKIAGTIWFGNLRLSEGD